MTEQKNKPLSINLNLLQYRDELNIRSSKEIEKQVFDPLRRDWYVMTPEEFVRQLLIQCLFEMGIGTGRISIERSMKNAVRRERYDLLILDGTGAPWMLAECKSFRVDLKQSTFDQSSRYNRQLGVQYQMITNGRLSYLCEIDYDEETYQFLNEFPELSR